MSSFAAMVLAATPLSAALPPGPRAVAGVQVEIVRAERVSAAPPETGTLAQAGALHRGIRQVPGGIIVDFD